MKAFRFVLLSAVVCVLGAAIGFMLSTRVTQEKEVRVVDLPRVMDEAPLINVAPPARQGTVDRSAPRGAIPDERAIQFASRADYLAYLQALSDAGLDVLGQIDELNVARVGLDVLRAVDPATFNGAPDFTYRVERPLPPEAIPPQLIGSLKAFDGTAKMITGGLVDGDGSGVIVAVLDSGIVTHSQFDDVHIVHMDLTGAGVGAPGAGHGTSVASIITGSEGIAPSAELLVVRVLDGEGNGNSFHVAEGIVQAVDFGAKVINLSLGVYQDSALLRNAVQYAHAQGVILVAAAGNDTYAQLPFPAAYSEVLAVTAVDAQGNQARFPNQSEDIDFAAPGVGVMTAKEDVAWVEFTGTSAAAPFVSGTLAALISAEPERAAQDTVELLKRYLNDAGEPGSDEVYGDGLLDWNRLRERDESGVLDLAIADVYLSQDAQPGTTMPIEVIVQNRGTAWFHDAELQVLVGEMEPVSFTLGSLGPGQIATRKVYTQVPPSDSEVMLGIGARLLADELMANDVRLENNIKAVLFRPRTSQ